MMLVPLGQGIAASIIAALMICAWIAIGSAFLGKRRSDDEICAPAAILIGSGATSFVLALFCAGGMVGTGVLAVSIASCAVALRRYRAVADILSGVLRPYRAALSSASSAIVGIVVGATMWIASIAPPRSADAMRYHLAHIRQIVQDDQWQPIADFHYALPFGWSLSYLPFELIGLPQGAQVLGLFLFVVFVSSVVRGLRRWGVGTTATIAAVVLMLHPAGLRVFTEASADAYSLLVILTISLLLIRHWEFDSSDVAVLGFVSWVGLQSRYQLLAAAIAATICVVLSFRQNPVRYGAAIAYIGGSVAGIALASPFYVMNRLSFGNFVWPLLIDVNKVGATYNDIVAHEYARSLTGRFVPGEIAGSVVTLFTTPFLFPLAIVLVVIIALALFVKETGAKLPGLFGAIFLLEWFLMQPLLYPRFVLLMLPVAVVCGGLLLHHLIERRANLTRAVHWVTVAAAFALTAVGLYINRDSIGYAATGDAKEFHRYTWFYRVYDWVNHNTPKDSRFLVIVSSGQTYYLDRPYRRADPWISGVVDWPKIDTGVKLDSVLAAGHYSYVIYDNRDWKDFPGGASTMKAVDDAYRSGLLKRIKSFEDTLYTSRARRKYTTAHVHVLQRAKAE